MFTFGLTIVRHGETPYNKDKLLQGQGVDLPLSETGLQQAEIVGNYLSDLKFTNAFSSDLQRARQSFGVAEGRPVDDLRNMASMAGQSCRSFTPPQGETPEQVKLRVEEFMRVLFQRMVSDHCSPEAQLGGPDCCDTAAGANSESDVSLSGRPDDGLLGVSAHALVVSHGAYMRIAVRYLVEDLQCSIPPDIKPSQLFYACPNTGICRFVFTLRLTDSGPTPAAIRCIFINRKEHLKAMKGTD